MPGFLNYNVQSQGQMKGISIWQILFIQILKVGLKCFISPDINCLVLQFSIKLMKVIIVMLLFNTLLKM